MQRCNILIGCDHNYYANWAINLLRSIHHFNPWITLHCHVVNPEEIEPLPFVEYTFENKEFLSEENKIGYLQCCRFKAIAEKFKEKDLVMSLDADSICTKAFTQEEFIESANKITVLRHLKDQRWLAGMITYGTGTFKKDFIELLNEKPEDQWVPFHDQNVLAELSKKYKYYEQPPRLFWMSIGKNGNKSVFLTLKGNQKEKHKYLKIYNEFLKGVV